MTPKKFIQWSLWAGAATVAIVLLSWKQGEETGIQLDIPAVDTDEVAKQSENISAETVLEEARYTGRNAKGQIWEVTAAQAVRSGAMGEDKVALKQVAATIENTSMKPVTFVAQQGEYQKQNNVLNLKGDALVPVVIRGYGLTVKAPEVTANLQNRNLTAGNPVKINGENVVGNTLWHSTFTGEHLKVSENTTQPVQTTLTLTGGVKGVFTPVPFISKPNPINE